MSTVHIPSVLRANVGGVVDPPRDGHDQPPAIAGRSLTSSSLVTGVSRPDR